MEVESPALDGSIRDEDTLRDLDTGGMGMDGPAEPFSLVVRELTSGDLQRAFLAADATALEGMVCGEDAGGEGGAALIDDQGGATVVANVMAVLDRGGAGFFTSDAASARRSGDPPVGDRDARQNSRLGFARVEMESAMRIGLTALTVDDAGRAPSGAPGARLAPDQA